MVVECTKGVGDIESVVPRVESAIEPFVCVECTVEPVLPGVNYKATAGILAFQAWNFWSRDCSLQSPEQLESRDEPPVSKVDYRWSPCLKKLLGAWRIAHVKHRRLDEDWTPLPHSGPVVDRLHDVLEEEGAYESL